LAAQQHVTVDAMASDSSVRGACPHDCPDRCAWIVKVERGVATSLVGDPDHPDTRGVLCAKVDHYLERSYSTDRVLHPLRRTGAKGSGTFERVSWDEALDDIAARLQRIISESGATSILPYSFSGTQGRLQANGMSGRFFNRIGASRLDQTICGTASTFGVHFTIGSSAAMLPQDLAYSRFIVLWGTNTVVTNLHLWPVIKKAQSNGAKVVVIDPLKTRTAAAADWHIRPLPGTDAALALGMMNVILGEGLHDAEYLEKYALGFEELKTRVAEYPPERVATLTGLDAQEIIELARAYATTKPAAIRVLVGMEHHAEGEMLFRAISCLPTLIGAWTERGGGLVHHPHGLFGQALKAIDMPELQDKSIRLINMVQLGRALTDATMDPPIRALFVYSSNPAVTTPNQNLVLQGLRREDLFTVVHEQFLTDTARHADYVLPATTQIEHWDLMASWGHTYLTLNRPAIEPLGEAVPGSELFRRLAAKMKLDEPYFKDTDEQMIQYALGSNHPYLANITYERLLRESWVPLSLPDPWMPLANGNYSTPSGKCELYSQRLADRGIDPLPYYREPAEASNKAQYPLMLLTPKSALHFLNSSYANMPRHLRAEGEPFVDINTVDASAREIADGQQVRIESRHGTLTLRARVGDRVRSGIVAIPSGWWATSNVSGLSVNALTGDGLTLWSGGADFHDTYVEIRSSR
jgi:anaerobic selenocysteine-containing dehydrogenase